MANLIEQGIMQWLQNCRAEDLQNAIREDISLKTIIYQMFPTQIEFIKLIAKFCGADSVSSNEILGYILQSRPDLAEILNTPAGNIWFKKQIMELKEML